MVCAAEPLNVVPDAAPVPELLKVRLLGVLAVIVADAPRAMVVLLTVMLALASLA